MLLPLPLAGEVDALARARRVGELSQLAPVFAEAPPPLPSPQAGEGAQRRSARFFSHANFLKRFNVICAVQSSPAKIFRFAMKATAARRPRHTS